MSLSLDRTVKNDQEKGTWWMCKLVDPQKSQWKMNNMVINEMIIKSQYLVHHESKDFQR